MNTALSVLVRMAVLAIAAAGFLLSPPSAHAETDCGYARAGVRVTAANEDTSCDFAVAVARVMMNGHGDGEPFQVFSEVTKQWYTMSCSIEGHGSTTCRGGNNAVVRIY